MTPCSELNLTPAQLKACLKQPDVHRHFADRGRRPAPERVEPFAIPRLAACDTCESNERGVCLEQKKLTPHKIARISVGVRMLRAKCPLGKWPAAPESGESLPLPASTAPSS